MNSEMLKNMFGMNGYFVRQVTDGVTDEEGGMRPRPAGNSMSWVLGHILYYRNAVLELVDEPRIWSEGEAAGYQRGAQPGHNGGGTHSLRKLLADFDRSQERLIAALDRLAPEALAAPADDGSGTLAERLAKWHFHETYHVGQMGLLRRIVGKPGAVG